jgi:hypothetical protein
MRYHVIKEFSWHDQVWPRCGEVEMDPHEAQVYLGEYIEPIRIHDEPEPKFFPRRNVGGGHPRERGRSRGLHLDED